jgi:hypothetical protein
VRKDCQCLRARHEHGTYGAYRCDGCRCFPCRLFTSRSGGNRRYDGVHISGVGTARRLQALAWAGWGASRLGVELGVTHTAVEIWRAGRADVRPETAARIAALYDRLWNATPPSRSGATRAHNHAVRNGWLPPLAWDEDTIDDPNAEDYAHILPAEYPNGLHTGISAHEQGNSPDLIDEIAVEQAMTGRRVHLNRVETSEAIARLTAMHYSAEEIGQRLGMSSRNVVRFRARAGESVAA